MKRIDHLADLPRVPVLAVIINCSTKWVSTLALLSTLRTQTPVLLIDCESTDHSFEHFEDLSRRLGLDFHWLSWPLRRHGIALDALFRDVPASTVLLVDSDVELREPAVVAQMRAALDADAKAYGAGFVHRAEWMDARHGLPEHIGFYAERMWIPLVLLRTVRIQDAIARGAGFAQQRVFSEIPGRPVLSRWIGARFWVPGLRNLGVARRDQTTPAFTEYDTGARIHRCLLGAGDTFATLPDEQWRTVHHYHGVTRGRMVWARRKLAQRLGLVGSANDTDQQTIDEDVKGRLRVHYGVHADGADPS